MADDPKKRLDDQANKDKSLLERLRRAAKAALRAALRALIFEILGFVSDDLVEWARNHFSR